MPASPPTSRVVAVLESLAESSGSLSASELARTLGLSTSTLSLILATLREANYVERLPDRTYRLGFGLLRLLEGLGNRFPLLGAANEELARLAAAAGCGCTLARLGAAGQEVILSVGVAPELGIRPGVHLPLHPPHGAVAMAWRSPREIDHWLADGSSAQDREELRRLRTAMADVRRLGYAVYGIRKDSGPMMDQLRGLLGAVQSAPSADVLREQLERLARAVGRRLYTQAELAARGRLAVSHVIAPVFGPDAQPAYLVSLHVTRDFATCDDLARYTGALTATAKSLTERIGGHLPKDVSPPAATARSKRSGP